MITVTFNGEALTLARGSSLADALTEAPTAALTGALATAQAGTQADTPVPLACATAVNGHFVPREARAVTLLQPGDAVTTFRAIVGG
jgi:sulfur carrier protein ThiS